ncbi:type VI secretion system-associated FHA domain protein TagH [Paraburkholderia edwinii]|uniref:Type VI secretion system-associated FHA domain protein TagH n=1 Tax=Paraburkholderia edwinii TaxID=2861782 RepID=A0ABX8UQS6_9BURK|nr:type VI secretion system-associated FHA domain protein TagH [Paraburkholderia edwinii]QYD71373.1 type VI secretion system-associated FHA domain protein TagH [Paraburkholderia edwinii]
MNGSPHLTLEVQGAHADRFGSRREQVFDERDGSIGRSEDCDWVLGAEGVSRLHALVRYLNGIYFIEDRSTNGMLLNGTPLSRGDPAALKDGDRLQIDEFEISVHVSGNDTGADAGNDTARKRDGTGRTTQHERERGATQRDGAVAGADAAGSARFVSVAHPQADFAAHGGPLHSALIAGSSPDALRGTEAGGDVLIPGVTDMPASSAGLDPLALFDVPPSFFDAPAPSAEPEPSWNHTPSAADRFHPPQAAPARQVAPVLPEDWDASRVGAIAKHDVKRDVNRNVKRDETRDATPDENRDGIRDPRRDEGREEGSHASRDANGDASGGEGLERDYDGLDERRSASGDESRNESRDESRDAIRDEERGEQRDEAHHEPELSHHTLDSHREQAQDAEPRRAPDRQPEGSGAPSSAAMSSQQLPLQQPQASPQPQSQQQSQAQPQSQLQPQPPAPPAVPSAQPAAATAATADSPHDLQAMFELAIDALMDVLRARAELKNSFRMPATLIQRSENNPLKFAPDAGEAVKKLLAPPNSTFLSGTAALNDAVVDIRNHQMAMLAGVRSAFESLLEHFDPARIEQDPEANMRRLPIGNRSRHWERYKEQFEILTRNPDECFRRLFGDAFARAYEDQLLRLKNRGN